jgi:hypothetical protein
MKQSNDVFKVCQLGLALLALEATEHRGLDFHDATNTFDSLPE